MEAIPGVEMPKSGHGSPSTRHSARVTVGRGKLETKGHMQTFTAVGEEPEAKGGGKKNLTYLPFLELFWCSDNG